jgi:hypothetical protein
MILADPLAPAMKMKSCALFVIGKLRIADEPEMRFESGVNQSVA